jgi:porphobilinogen synthase
MVRETTLHVEDLIYPLFVMEGTAQREAVASMPGCYRYTLDLLLVEIKAAAAQGGIDEEAVILETLTSMK